MLFKNTDFQLQKFVKTKSTESETEGGAFCILKSFSGESDALQTIELYSGWEITKTM